MPSYRKSREINKDKLRGEGIREMVSLFWQAHQLIMSRHAPFLTRKNQLRKKIRKIALCRSPLSISTHILGIEHVIVSGGG